MAGNELHQFFIAHRGGGALRYDRLFELRRFAQIVNVLLLDRTAAGDVNLIRIHQMVADLFEELVRQGDFEVVRGILVRIGPRTRILGMTKDGEDGGFGVIADDGRVMRVHPDSETLFDFVRHRLSLKGERCE